MLVNKTKAAEIAGVSRRTFYNHIPQKRISVVPDDDGVEKVDIAELERVYGRERVQRNLKSMEDAQDQTEMFEPSSRQNTPGSVQYDVLLMKEQLKNLEAMKEQMRSSHDRERDQLLEEIENLREGLRKAQDHHAQLTLLITDQSKEKDQHQKSNDQKLKAMEDMISILRRQNKVIVKELQNSKSKSFWGRIFGS
jgi:hypothetical protein